MRTQIILLSLILLIAGRVKAQEVMPLSLEYCMKYAKEHADTLKNARINVEIQRAQNAQLAAQALPNIRGGGNFTYNLNPQQALLPGEFFGQPGTFQPVVFSPVFVTNANVSGSQTIFDGSLMVALKARKTILELVRDAGHLTEENVRYGIQKAYYSIVIAQRQYNILIGSLENARKISGELRVIHENGMNELLDVQRSDVQVNNLETDSVRTASLLESSKQLLKYQIGMNIDQPIVLTDTIVESFFLQASDLLNNELDYNSRTEFSLVKKQLSLYEYNVRRYQFAALPTLSASGQIGYNYGSDQFSEITKFRKNYLFSTYVALQLNVPIFSGFLRKNQVKEARLNVEKAQNNIELLKLSLDFQDAQAKTTLKNALLAVEKQKRNLSLSNSIADLAVKKYKEGVGSSVEVTQAQSELLQSQNNYFQALLDVINAQADLQKALGQFAN